MDGDIFKVLALILCGGLGYFYAHRKGAPSAPERMAEVIKEEKREEEKVNAEVKASPLSNLISAANERLRKRRGGGS